MSAYGGAGDSGGGVCGGRAKMLAAFRGGGWSVNKGSGGACVVYILTLGVGVHILTPPESKQLVWFKTHV